MAKKKNEKSTIKSFEELDQKLLELGKAESFIAEQEAEMNRQLQQVRDEFENKTADQRAAKLLLENDIELFCIENKDQFEKTKSRDLVHGRVGFRFGKPKLTLLSRKYNWDTAQELLKKLFDFRYIRTKAEIDKDRIITEAFGDKPRLSDKDLAGVGLKLDQDEKFFYEIKWESLNQ